MSKLPLQELTRQAFRYPEKGSINFNLLETIILSILKKLKLDEAKVPYHIATDEPEEEVTEQPEYSYSDDYLLNEEPPEVIETLWKSFNTDRRIAGAEKVLNNICGYIDDLYDKIREINDKLNLDELAEILKFADRMRELEEKCRQLDQRIDDTDEKRVSEIERLEEIIKEMKEEQASVKSEIEVIKDDLYKRVAYKRDLDILEDDLNTTMMEIKELIPSEDTLVTKPEHEELCDRVEKLEEIHDSFARLGYELEILKSDVEDLQKFREEARTFFSKLSEMEIILDEHEIKFDGIKVNLDAINEKLAQIDPDDINDSFARLEEEMEMLKNEMETVKYQLEECEKKVEHFSTRISNLSQWLNRLEQVKMDKADLKGLLDTKADLKLVKQKLDRNEFSLVVGDLKDIKEDLERLTCKVQINQETADERFGKVNEELSLQMYKEDFIIGTEPIRNRIKALIYELKRVKEIALAHLFPDACGIAKCMTCNRGAHMGGAKYCGDAPAQFDDNEPSESRIRKAIDKSSMSDKDFENTYGLSVPPIDLESIPFPPPDAPRERNQRILPVLLAKAQPNVGLKWEKRRRDIDNDLEDFFSKKPVRPLDASKTSCTKFVQGEKTGTSFNLPPVNNNYNGRGTVRRESKVKESELAQARSMLKPSEAFKRGTVFDQSTASQKKLFSSKQYGSKERK